MLWIVEFRKNKTGCEIAWSLWLFTIYAVNLFSTAIDSTSVVLCDKIKIKSSEFHISSSFFSLAAYDRPKSFITTWNGNFMEARKNRFTKIENWIISTSGVNFIQIHSCNIASKIGNRNSRHRVFVLRFNAYLHIRYYLFNSDYWASQNHQPVHFSTSKA